MTIYTYTPDMTRPLCPECGSAVSQETDTPEIAWVGVCGRGHEHTFQLEEESDL